MSASKEKLECFVSVVAVIRNQWPLLEKALPRLQAYLERHFADYEIVLVDQRSSDSTTREIDGLLKRVPCIRFIELSFRVDQEVALSAGLENSIGDYIVLMNLETDPPEEIRPMVMRAIEGPDIVAGTTTLRTSLAYKSFRPIAEIILRRIGYTLPKGTTHFMVISRRAANAVMSVGRFHHKFLVRLSKTGYPSEGYKYKPEQEGSSRKALGSGLSSLLRMIVYNSTLPLRWMSLAGLGGSALAFLFALYSFLTKLLMENVAAGWASSVMFQSFMFMLMFTMLAFFGEYLARLLDDQGGYKDYAVVSERHSSVLLDENRVNVLNQSE